MDKLQHIDNLLKRASQEPANALVNDSDWKVVEQKLKHRKNRVFAMWFFLALVSVSVISSVLYMHQSAENPLTKAPNETIPDMPKTLVDQNTVNKLLPLDSTLKYKTTSLEKENIKPKSKKHYNTPPIETETDKISNGKISTTTPASDVLSDVYRANPILQPISNSPKSITQQNLSTITLYNWDIKHPTDKLSFLNNTKTDKNNQLHKPKKGYWEIGFAFTPSISNKIETKNTTLAGLINKNYYNYVADGEKSSFGSSIGINFQYHNTSNWYVASGLFITQRTENVNYDYTVTDIAVPSNNIIYEYAPIINPENYIRVNYQGSNSYHFIEIPINVGYKQSISPKFELRSQAGVSYMALQNRNGKKGDFLTLELKDLTQLDLKSRNIAANIKSGLYYNTSRVAIGLEPMFGINLNSLNNEATSAIKTKPYSYGLNLTTNIKLIKR